jgi:VIT1/CCC1 family predicted Fe2+/Mn2+ transporter
MTLLRASVLGGVDGVITSFAIVAASAAGGVSLEAVVVVGAASVLADGLSMGISEYLSSYSQAARGRVALVDRPEVLGLACFFSFVVCGCVPLFVYVVGNQRVLACAMFSLVELMLLGAARTLFTQEWILAGLVQTSVLGSLAGGVAYGVGYAAHKTF